jgi:hypothetical protein
VLQPVANPITALAAPPNSAARFMPDRIIAMCPSESPRDPLRRSVAVTLQNCRRPSQRQVAPVTGPGRFCESMVQFCTTGV